jgi:BTB/POZ domain-containing protein KCTD9
LPRETETSEDKVKLAIAILGFTIISGATPLSAQSMTDMVDFTTDAYTKAEMSRADIATAIGKLPPGEKLDLSGKALNGLDLSGMDLRRVNLQAARIMRTNFSNSNLDGVNLDSAWSLNSKWVGAKLRGASLFQTQLQSADLEGADFSEAHVAGDFSKANLRNAIFDKADLSPNEANQSMGLMRGTFRNSTLDGASFRGANMHRVLIEFSSLKDANLTGANLDDAELGGSSFEGANVSGANLLDADFTSANVGGIKNLKEAKNWNKAKGLPPITQ